MRRYELAANLVFLSPMILFLGLALVIWSPINYIIIGTLYACGLIDLVYAKLPLLRHHVFNTFGPSHIPRKRRDAYFRGYRRIGLGIAFNLLVVLYYCVTGPPL
jgi:hypothetical protein